MDLSKVHRSHQSGRCDQLLQKFFRDSEPAILSLSTFQKLGGLLLHESDACLQKAAFDRSQANRPSENPIPFEKDFFST